MTYKPSIAIRTLSLSSSTITSMPPLRSLRKRCLPPRRSYCPHRDSCLLRNKKRKRLLCRPFGVSSSSIVRRGTPRRNASEEGRPSTKSVTISIIYWLIDVRLYLSVYNHPEMVLLLVCPDHSLPRTKLCALDDCCHLLCDECLS